MIGRPVAFSVFPKRKIEHWKLEKEEVRSVAIIASSGYQGGRAGGGGDIVGVFLNPHIKRRLIGLVGQIAVFFRGIIGAAVIDPD
jgi:hypothetical protein